MWTSTACASHFKNLLNLLRLHNEIGDGTWKNREDFGPWNVEFCPAIGLKSAEMMWTKSGCFFGIQSLCLHLLRVLNYSLKLQIFSLPHSGIHQAEKEHTFFIFRHLHWTNRARSLGRVWKCFSICTYKRRWSGNYTLLTKSRVVALNFVSSPRTCNYDAVESNQTCTNVSAGTVSSSSNCAERCAHFTLEWAIFLSTILMRPSAARERKWINFFHSTIKPTSDTHTFHTVLPLSLLRASIMSTAETAQSV